MTGDAVGLAETGDPFRRHRLALRVLAPGLNDEGLRNILSELSKQDTSSFADFLAGHGLSALWHCVITADRGAAQIPQTFLAALRQRRVGDAASYLGQKAVLSELDSLFETRQIAYAVMKGAHVREVVYTDPALRSASDIDILVARESRAAVAQALQDIGFTIQPDAQNISHEATFTRGAVDIDLHWDILRPGRTRIEVVASMLIRRQRVGDFWGLHDTDTVFLMLVHPAFAKYVCSPNMGLNRVADFALWLQRRPVEWDGVAALLEATGLKSAAWTQARWFAMLLEPNVLPLPAAFIEQISPGPMRARYLDYWLHNDLPGRWLDNPRWIQIGFTLPLHDRFSDAARAVVGLIQARTARAPI